MKGVRRGTVFLSPEIPLGLAQPDTATAKESVFQKPAEELVLQAAQTFSLSSNSEAAYDVYYKDVLVHDTLFGLKDYEGVEKLRENHIRFRKVCEDFQVEIKHISPAGHSLRDCFISYRWEASGRFTGNYNGIQGTGKPFKIYGMTQYHVVNAKINEIWSVVNPLGCSDLVSGMVALQGNTVAA